MNNFVSKIMEAWEIAMKEYGPNSPQAASAASLAITHGGREVQLKIQEGRRGAGFSPVGVSPNERPLTSQTNIFGLGKHKPLGEMGARPAGQPQSPPLHILASSAEVVADDDDQSQVQTVAFVAGEGQAIEQSQNAPIPMDELLSYMDKSNNALAKLFAAEKWRNTLRNIGGDTAGLKNEKQVIAKIKLLVAQKQKAPQ